MILASILYFTIFWWLLSHAFIQDKVIKPCHQLLWFAGHHPHQDMYDIRPAPVGKSATNEDAPSRLSHTSTKIPSPRNHQHSMSMYTQPSTSRSQPNFDFAKTVEDSLKLSRSRHSSNHQNLPSKSMQIHANNFPSTQHFGHRPPSQPSFTHPSHRLLQVTQRSMPALHINYPMPAGGYVPSGHGPLPSQPQNLSFSNRDPYLQHAYNRLQQRRALLTAIRWAYYLCRDHSSCVYACDRDYHITLSFVPTPNDQAPPPRHNWFKLINSIFA